MRHIIDFITIVKYAWMAYDSSREIKTIRDISANVSTNHVYRIDFESGGFVIAKLSYFGKYEHFVEDHRIINVLANNLPDPFANFLARSLILGSKLFVHRFTNQHIDAWVVFYKAIQIGERLPRRLDDFHIKKLGSEFANFHKTCHEIRHTLPTSSKTMKVDLDHLLEILNTDLGQYEHRGHIDEIKKQVDLCIENINELNANQLPKIPVFVDWNIGNFSVDENCQLFSRWDYDWFRMSSRMMDFYFLSRIVSNVGDRTVFTYNVGPMMEDRFVLFLKEYHKIFPFTEVEIRLLKEVYRFFILNYVIKDGRYIFHEIYASQLQKEAYESDFPNIDEFDAEFLLKELKI
jgi:Ser/Thr protein kinase RdoA (MazF antagonist)